MQNLFYLALMKLPDTGPTTQFYDAWSSYLKAMPRLLFIIIEFLSQGLADLIFDLGNAVLTAWAKVWDLADFSGIFAVKHAGDMTGYNLEQYVTLFASIGMIVFAIVMYVQLFMFTLTSGQKGKDWPRGLAIIFTIIGMLPLIISGGTAIAKSANSTFLPKDNNVLVQVWRNNSVDMEKVADDNFDVSLDKLKDYSPIKEKDDPAVVKASFFSNVMDDNEINKITGSNKDAAKKVFKQKRGLDAESKPEELDKGSWFTGGIFNEVYPRIKVNWLGIIGAEITFAIVGFLAIIEVTVRIYRIAYYSITLLIFAFRDLKGEKAMQILHLIEGSFIGMALMPLNVLMFFAFIQWAMTKTESMGLSAMPYTILSIGLMIGGAKGLLGGFSLIDDWTGVPTGHGNTAQSLIAAGMAAKTVDDVAKGLGKTAKAGFGGTKALVENAGNAAAKISDKVHSKMNDFALQRAANGMKVPLNPQGKNDSDGNGTDSAPNPSAGDSDSKLDKNKDSNSGQDTGSANKPESDHKDDSDSGMPTPPPNPAGPNAQPARGDENSTANKAGSAQNRTSSKNTPTQGGTGGPMRVPMNGGNTTGQRAVTSPSSSTGKVSTPNQAPTVPTSSSLDQMPADAPNVNLDNSAPMPDMSSFDSVSQPSDYSEDEMPPLPTQAELDEMMPPIEIPK
ncbi:hypothetical protein WOSG25_070270 [Weissella oryzae SG25]|uniref:DUF8208 domain-containing protein n=1 Tax=Weissella oryzae (strain DSM 25784 / JCM 18191 / LMG 30913 / SG25) TaxID=1329250 RepID=A0A069CTB1_WEIOS|nr:hypothetical protein [Weissella oryzae]GAK31050.1 hypothetical protein WOSG25_070270 [Weissella oryzae SG25]